MGRMKDWALDNELREKEINLLREEALYEIEKIKSGLPQTITECHEMIKNIVQNNSEQSEMLDEMSKTISKSNSFCSKVKTQFFSFLLGVIASLLSSWIFIHATSS